MIVGISELQVACVIGCLEKERKNEQTLLVDLRVEIDLPQEDSIRKTVNYDEVVKTVRKIAVEGKFQLLESLVVAIVETLLDSFPMIRAMGVKIKKPAAIQGAACSYVEYERCRK